MSELATIGKYKPYPAYKDSGIKWIGKVPENWGIKRNKQCFHFKKSTVGKSAKDYQLLSLTLEGIKERDIESGQGKMPAEFDTYQKVEPNDVVFCLFDIDETPRTVGLSSYKGMITGAYSVAEMLNDASPRFFFYYYLAIDYRKGLKPFYTGLRKVVRPETFLNIKVHAPSYSEQVQIANFLDQETSKIDTLIEKQQKLIELLKEKRQAVISHAVTKGLNPNAKMKDSGIQWLGDIPEYWTLLKIKHFGRYKSGDFIQGETIQDEGNYPVYGGNGLRGYYSEYTHKGEYVLIGRQGALCGNINYANGKFWATEHAIVVHLRKNLDIKYVGELLRTMNLGQYSVSAAQPGIGVENISNVYAVRPPLSEQQEIADYLDTQTQKIDTLIDKSQQAIALLKERKTALISAAVTGKIDVREVTNG